MSLRASAVPRVTSSGARYAIVPISCAPLAVLAVIAEGCTVSEVASRFGVSRQTLHAWLSKYEAGGLENLGDGSHRPRSCPHQMSGEVEVLVAELRRAHPYLKLALKGSPSIAALDRGEADIAVRLSRP